MVDRGFTAQLLAGLARRQGHLLTEDGFRCRGSNCAEGVVAGLMDQPAAS